MKALMIFKKFWIMVVKFPRDKGKKIKWSAVKISSLDMIQLIETISVESDFNHV